MFITLAFIHYTLVCKDTFILIYINISIVGFVCRCTKCDPDTGECMDGETCIDGHPRGMGFEWRGEGCRTGE